MFTQEKCESDPGFLSKTLLHGCRSTPGNLAGILIMLLNISQRKDMIFKMIKLLCISVTLKEGSLKARVLTSHHVQSRLNVASGSLPMIIRSIYCYSAHMGLMSSIT